MKNGLQKTLYTLGIDEVGRGPLAGPVAVGVVRTSLTRKEYTKLLFGIRDSKKAKKLNVRSGTQRRFNGRNRKYLVGTLLLRVLILLIRKVLFLQFESVCKRE